MQEITKAQITMGLLAFFATMWTLVRYAINSQEYIYSIQMILAQFVVMMVLSFILLTILQWIRLFDLKTNSIITLITLITIPVILSTTITL